MDQIYREQIIDHYKNPRHQGSVADATNTADLKNLSCGDAITISAKLDGEIIEDVKFEGEGCAICIASTSLILGEAIGLNKKEIENMTYDDIQEMIGAELSPSRIKCAHLGLLTLQKAIKEN